MSKGSDALGERRVARLVRSHCSTNSYDRQVSEVIVHRSSLLLWSCVAKEWSDCLLMLWLIGVYLQIYLYNNAHKPTVNTQYKAKLFIPQTLTTKKSSDA